MNLENLLYKNVKLRPYFGSSQTEVNIQNFEIIKAIGSGGFSTVFLVRFKADGKFYGMKAISKAFISKNKKQRLIIN
jgi:serine/threonine protein kinase